MANLASAPAVEVIDLKFQIRQFEILRGLSLRIEPGTIFGLLGPNGAGKTTTLRLLLGKLVPTSGSISVLGVEPRRGGADWRARLGWMGEAPGHYARLSAHANLLFFGGLYGAPAERSEKLLVDFGLWEKRNVAARSLSKGQRQKLALARALLSDPDILFLDEPTSGMDVESARSLRQLVRDWALEGKTVVLTTHDMEEAEDLCGIVGFVEGGQVIATGTPEALCQEVLHQEYLKRSDRPSLERVYLNLRTAKSTP